MNFLAHSMFAQLDQEVIVGQFCGDFVRGSQLDEYPAGIQRGIRLHRKIDSYTDTHPVNLQARNLFAPPYRRFASILTDVVYDHYLARDWSRYSDRALEEHIVLVHCALEDHFEVLPARLQRFARLLIDENLLHSYLSFDAVELALSRLSWRSERFKVLASAGAVLRREDQALSLSFAHFFPDLIHHMASKTTESKSP